MKYSIVWCLVVMLTVFVLPSAVYASYVLPYPSYMPGNKMYRITRIIDRLKQPFYFGNLSSFKYHLSLSDKYLVEAKTLFEYKQYLLAVDALKRSDKEFSQVSPFITGAEKEGKDIRTFASMYKDAAQEHVRILTMLAGFLPESFEWSPEKTAPTSLSLDDFIKTSITLRDANK